jgi:hypothetical protein
MTLTTKQIELLKKCPKWYLVQLLKTIYPNKTIKYTKEEIVTQYTDLCWSAYIRDLREN